MRRTTDLLSEAITAIKQVNRLAAGLAQCVFLTDNVDSADPQSMTWSDSRESIGTDFLLVPEFFVVITRKTAINFLITARNLRFYRKCGNSLSAVRKLSPF